MSSLYFVPSIVSLKKQSVGKVLPHVMSTWTSHRVEAELQVSDDAALSSTVQHLYNEADPVSVEVY